MKHITIYENGAWAGGGKLVDGHIEDCPAVLGDDQDMADEAYQAIEDAIAIGASAAVHRGYKWTWTITEAG
jgi:hypothetical protein